MLRYDYAGTNTSTSTTMIACRMDHQQSWHGLIGEYQVYVFSTWTAVTSTHPSTGGPASTTSSVRARGPLLLVERQTPWSNDRAEDPHTQAPINTKAEHSLRKKPASTPDNLHDFELPLQ